MTGDELLCPGCQKPLEVSRRYEEVIKSKARPGAEAQVVYDYSGIYLHATCHSCGIEALAPVEGWVPKNERVEKFTNESILIALTRLLAGPRA